MIASYQSSNFSRPIAFSTTTIEKPHYLHDFDKNMVAKLNIILRPVLFHPGIDIRYDRIANSIILDETMPDRPLTHVWQLIFSVETKRPVR